DLALLEASLDPGAMLPGVLPAARWGVGDDLEPTLERGTGADTAPLFAERSGRGTFAIACALCRHGDSGSGIYDSAGKLLGVLVALRGCARPSRHHDRGRAPPAPADAHRSPSGIPAAFRTPDTAPRGALCQLCGGT
ncbi:MAG: hypothetical protein ABI346_03895, partial [Candidatus Baltobacteraceae bacterium]